MIPTNIKCFRCKHFKDFSQVSTEDAVKFSFTCAADNSVHTELFLKCDNFDWIPQYEITNAEMLAVDLLEYETMDSIERQCIADYFTCPGHVAIEFDCPPQEQFETEGERCAVCKAEWLSRKIADN